MLVKKTCDVWRIKGLIIYLDTLVKIESNLRMKRIHRVVLSLFFAMSFWTSVGQETLPIYADYLSDNVFLIHPSAAGIGNCGKIRLTAR